MKDTRYIDGFIGELLHINEVADNKLIDLNAGGGATFILSRACVDLSAYAVKTAAERWGKTGNTVLLNSALAGGEQRVTTGSNTFSWQAADGGKDVKALHSFISGARKDLIARGNNPMFLSVGALRWRVCVKEQGKEILKDITTPFLIYPVKLVVASNSAPVSIEFIADDVYVNPCLTAKLAQVYSKELADGLPAVGSSLSEPVDLAALGDGAEYFKKVAEYVKSCNLGGGDNGTLFEFDKDIIAVSQYKHDELCTYYDIRRNKDKIYSHRLVEKMFEKSSPDDFEGGAVLPEFVLQRDSVQENIISSVVNGRSLIVKGPPGTGKTVTIANMLAALLSRGKKVLFASKKISALTEVYAKLPEPLRKFTMLLDSETEKSAANMRPEEIKQDFKRLLADCREYRACATLEADVAQATAERAKAMRSLSAYAELMFNDKCIAGDSFYSALAAACADCLPTVEFADENQVKSVSREQYNIMLGNVGEAEKAFAVLTDGGAHEAYKSPWFGIDLSCGSDGAVSACSDIAEAVNAVYKAVSDCGICADGFNLSEIAGAVKSTLKENDIKTLAGNNGCGQALDRIKQRLSGYEKCAAEPLGLREDISVAKLGGAVEKLSALSVYHSLNLKDLRLICANAQLLNAIGDDAFSSLVSVLGKMENVKKESRTLLEKCCEVFDENSLTDGGEKISAAANGLSRYFENCPAKPKTFDFKAKKAYASLCAFSFLKSPSFRDIVGSTELYCRSKALKSELETGKESLYKIFRRRLEDEQIDCINAVAQNCASAHTGLRAYVEGACANAEFISGCYAFADGAEKAENTTVGELSDGLNTAYNLLLLKNELTEFNKILSVYDESGKGKEREIAASLTGGAEFVFACKKQGMASGDIVKAYARVSEAGAGLADKIDRVTDALAAFGVNYFKNYYAILAGDCTFGDLKILVAQSCNREILAAAASYTAIKHDPKNALDLSEFLYPFEKGEKLPAGASFKDAFAHSFFTLAVRAKNAELKILRNGLGARANNNFDKLEEADKKLCALNAKLVEGKCLSRIKPDDKDFIFVEDRNPGENMRLMFKRHAKAILKLKRCLILSPYTASLLFDGKEYEDFDVLIVDEASQLEPALILPVLFRSKQCVIVGDEWQMPPIKHFATLSPVQNGDGEGYSALESEISVLGLALRNGGFPVEELVCHYRSNTESLIKFSQKLFYPNMRTFPAPVPARQAAKGVAGLGIKDVYVENGVVCAGKNIAEADRVVEELKLHFDNYYDEKTHKLSMPVGVVAFGEAQCSLIVSKVQADNKLYKKIQDALEKFDDLPEKLIFFKTIETVQGQETGHLILSLTHGKRESGLYMHFGQLNQGKLGRCIFNVAVTRAQNMVTVIHSVRAAEVTAENVSYIREYLETAARFAVGESGQFVCGEAENGFIKSVVGFILSKGIAPERVVVNYGVTEGSVRIPIAVLDESLTRAQLGIWCEKPAGGGYDFLDYNMRYPSSLAARGWNLHRIFIHDWVDNNLNERQSLERALAEINNRKENN